MDTVIDDLFMEWHAHGSPVLMAVARPTPSPRPIEELIAASTAQCRASGRLTWVVLAALIDHADEINPDALIEDTLRIGDLSVLGVLSDAADQRQPHPLFQRLIMACAPNAALEPFFHRVARSPLATRLAREQAVDVFRRWNFWSGELQYLDHRSAAPTSSAQTTRTAR